MVKKDKIDLVIFTCNCGQLCIAQFEDEHYCPNCGNWRKDSFGEDVYKIRVTPKSTTSVSAFRINKRNRHSRHVAEE